MQGYTLAQTFITFLIYAFLGWGLEVGFHIFKSHKFINRGFLQGPLCPIYGVGAVLVLFFLGHLENNMISIFLGGAVFASILELITGYALKKIFNTRWWNYSHKRFNIGGYISLDFTIIWGFVSIFMMKVLQPRVAKIVERIPDNLVNTIAIIFLIIFLTDLATTVKSLVSFRTVLQELSEMRIELDERLEQRKLQKDIVMEQKKQEAIKEWEASEKTWKEQSKVYEKKRLERLRSLNSRLETRHRSFLEEYPDICSDELREKLKNLKKK